MSSCNTFGTTFLPTQTQTQTRPIPGSFFKPIKASSSSSSSVSVGGSSASHYELLGIPETGDLVMIKKAYKKMARKYHPDVSPPGRVDEYTQRFIRVQEAYETLSDPKRRELYDEDMSNGGVHFDFSLRRHCRRDVQQTVDKSEWRAIWEAQIEGLKNREPYRDSGGNLSWGERMRRRMESESQG